MTIGMRGLKYVGFLAAGAALILGAGKLFSGGLVGPPPPLRQPNVLLIVIDSLRRDRLGTYGSTKGLTPFLDSLASECIVYDEAYAPSSWTVPTVASLFLAKHPSEHGVVRFFTAIPRSALTLAQVLSANGYTTAGFTANAAIQDKNRFNMGFQRYRLVGQPTFLNPKADGSLVNEAVSEWITQTGSQQQPFFLYLHYMDPHAPYKYHEGITAARPPDIEISDQQLNLRAMTGSWAKDEEERRRKWNFTPVELQRLEDLYDGEVRYGDQRLKELFAELADRGVLDRALVIVAADHGEEFGEHGVFGHGLSLFQEVIRVPLIICLPGNTRHARISEPVQLSSLGPTLLQELRIEVPAAFHIEPLPLHGPSSGPQFAYSELLETKQYQIRLHERALSGAASKLLVTSDGEHVSFDLDNDPDEQHPRVDASGDLRRALARVQRELAAPEVKAPEVDLDEATRERLRGLGYFPAAE